VTTFIMLAIKSLFCLVIAAVGLPSGASSHDNQQRSTILRAQQQSLTGAVFHNIQRQRNLQWEIEFTPDSDPEFVCNEYKTRLQKDFQCDCDIQPDKSVGIKCSELNSTCNADDSLCFLQTVSLSLTPKLNEIIALETCSEYITNFTRFEGSSTKFANYSEITPCVTVRPTVPNNFTFLESCFVTVNGVPCQTCEICDDKAPALAVTIDCCNTSPSGEQLKMTCGLVGNGGGTFDTLLILCSMFDECSFLSCSFIANYWWPKQTDIFTYLLRTIDLAKLLFFFQLPCLFLTHTKVKRRLARLVPSGPFMVEVLWVW